MRILQVCPTLDSDGIARLLYNYFIRIDNAEIEVDFVVHDYIEKGILEDELKNRGYNIFHITSYENSKIKCITELAQIIKKGQYDVVHCHMHYRNLFIVLLAKRYGIKRIIVHSHVAYQKEGIIQSIKHKVTIPIIKIFATGFWACSKDAGIWMFGKNIVKSKHFYVLNNAIDLSEFCYSKQQREEFRNEFGIKKDEIVIGCIGRYADQKNYPFLFEVFNEILSQEHNAKLVIAGTRKKVEELNSSNENSVFVLGVRNDIGRILSGIDCFVLPSKYEGLGIVYVEAQTNGALTFASSNVPKEVKVLPQMKMIPLNCTAKEWAKIILNDYYLNEIDRSEAYHTMNESCFNIENEVKKLEKKYTTLL